MQKFQHSPLTKLIKTQSLTLELLSMKASKVATAKKADMSYLGYTYYVYITLIQPTIGAFSSAPSESSPSTMKQNY